MKKAKYYIYRNLHKGGFSVRLRGRVVDYIDSAAVCMGVEFKVSRKGRERVLQEGKKNVHAYVVCEKYYKTNDRSWCAFGHFLEKVTYDPYERDHFINEEGVKRKGSFMCLLKDEEVFLR